MFGAWHLLRLGLAGLSGFVRRETGPRHTGAAPRQLDLHCAGPRVHADRVRLPHRLSQRSEVERHFFRLQQYDRACLVGRWDLLLSRELLLAGRLVDGAVRGGVAALSLTFPPQRRQFRFRDAIRSSSRGWAWRAASCGAATPEGGRDGRKKGSLR